MLITLWRLLLALTDLRRWTRLLRGQPTLDVVFITNIRDDAERRRFFPKGANRRRHASGPKIYLQGIAAQVRGINLTAEEMYTTEGRRLARAVFVDAVRWADRRGAKVVLLAASTKRLFGRDGADLKEIFPHMIFTIGDNGTSLLLWADVERAISQAQLDRTQLRALVIGPYGILGGAISEHLSRQGYEVVGYGHNTRQLADFSARTGLPVVDDTARAGQVDLVVACTHSAEAKLNTADIAHLRRPHRKLLVVDVAEPANLDEDTLDRCADHVVRQDAGNGYSPWLTYVLGRSSRAKLQLPEGTVFGCFAEAMALFNSIYRQHNTSLRQRDWFQVNREQTALIGKAFLNLDIGLPPPHCFGQPVHGFDLHPSPNPANTPTGTGSLVPDGQAA